MSKVITKPVSSKEDLKWKAIAATQSTCDAVVSLVSYISFTETR